MSLLERFSPKEVGALRQGISPGHKPSNREEKDMGYESRLYVVNRRELKWDGKLLGIYRDMIAKFDMSCVGWNPEHIFTTPIDFPIEYDENDEEVYDDMYGKRCGMTSVSAVISAIEALEEREHYRRFKPLLGFLKALDESEWDDLRVVHFGY